MSTFDATIHLIVDCGPGVGPQLVPGRGGIVVRIPSRACPKSSSTRLTNDGTHTGWLPGSSSLPVDLVPTAPHGASATSVVLSKTIVAAAGELRQLRQLKMIAECP
ncbi:hypothetical protein FS837_006500, partial [Tulasnella sp. UAMH 9824]